MLPTHMGPRRLLYRLLTRPDAGFLLSAWGRTRWSAASLQQARQSSFCLARPGVGETGAIHRWTRGARCSGGGNLVRHVDWRRPCRRGRRTGRVMTMNGGRLQALVSERVGDTAPAKKRQKRASACTRPVRGRSCTSCSLLPHHRRWDRRWGTWSWPCEVRATVRVRRLPSPKSRGSRNGRGL